MVQRQIACDRAGVGFSINPVSGQLDRLVIDANYGLGESVVSGEGEVDHFELDKESLQVDVPDHRPQGAASCSGGRPASPRKPFPPSWPIFLVFDEAELREVATLLKKIEAHYGWPQDIEWGFCKGSLFLFQSRPVTTIQPR